MRARLRLIISMVLLSLVGCGGGSGNSAAPRYRVTPLNSSVELFGMNNQGLFVGATEPTLGHENTAIILSNGKVTLLPTLANEKSSIAGAVNSSGQIAGSVTIGSDPYQQAFYYSNGQIQNISMSGANNNAGQAINDLGQVTGSAVIPNTGTTPNQSAFLWQNGQMTLLPTLGGNYSIGNGINNQGQVAGDALLSDEATSNAVLWDKGKITQLAAVAPISAANASALAINNHGQIVGSAYSTDGNLHAVLWENGTEKDLGVYPGDNWCSAASINDQGDIVGNSTTISGPSNGSPSDRAISRNIVGNSTTISGPGTAKGVARRPRLGGVGTGHPFLYHAGQRYNLNDLLPAGSGWVLGTALQINNQGQILAQGTFQGNIVYCLLTPQ